MSYITPSQARDEVFTLVTDLFGIWNVANGYNVDVRYQGKLRVERPFDFWFRLSMQQVSSVQASFVRSEDGADRQHFETSGLVFAQVNTAMTTEDSFAIGDAIATAIRDMLRNVDTPSGVLLRNARYTEVPSDDEFYKWNVIAEYLFDEAN